MGMKNAKRTNYQQIYLRDQVSSVIDGTVKPMMQEMYTKLLRDLKDGNKSSPIFTHHVDFVMNNHYAPNTPYMETEPNQIVVDYMASMTDDYCADLYSYLFPKSNIEIQYKGYFD
jgi:dGTPase